jgi:periplasmic protein TonB
VASVNAIARSLLVIAMLVMWAATARAQAGAPSPDASPTPVEVQAKPPDEPSSSASDAEVEPDAGASPAPAEPGDDSNAPLSADRVAHPPEIETYVVPEYPQMARKRGVEGRVLLSVVIDASGKVEDRVEVLDSIPMLDQAAIDAVHQWSFSPARDAEGIPVRVQMTVPVRFTLR